MNYFGERWVRRKMARQPSNEAGDAMFPESVAFGLGLAFAFALSLLVFVAFGGFVSEALMNTVKLCAAPQLGDLRRNPPRPGRMCTPGRGLN